MEQLNEIILNVKFYGGITPTIKLSDLTIRKPGTILVYKMVGISPLLINKNGKAIPIRFFLKSMMTDAVVPLDAITKSYGSVGVESKTDVEIEALFKIDNKIHHLSINHSTYIDATLCQVTL